MARPTKKMTLKRSKRRVSRGIIHVQATFNNTIVTITNAQGQVIAWSSAGACGFKGAKKSTSFAAQTAAANAVRSLAEPGLGQADAMIKGPGVGRDTALRAVRSSGVMLNLVRDVTSMPHNGCRPPKRRRV